MGGRRRIQRFVRTTLINFFAHIIFGAKIEHKAQNARQRRCALQKVGFSITTATVPAAASRRRFHTLNGF
jgi:type VI protein secretion system component VasA